MINFVAMLYFYSAVNGGGMTKEIKMIKCKEDLVNTYIVNDKGVLRDLYLNEGKRLGLYFDILRCTYVDDYIAILPHCAVAQSCSRIPESCQGRQLHLPDLIDLENSKVYTTDMEVIHKYSQLCGKVFSPQFTNMQRGVFNEKRNEHIYDFSFSSLVDGGGDYHEITPEQINALHAEKFSKQTGGLVATEEPEQLHVRLGSDHKTIHVANPLSLTASAETPEEKEVLDSIGTKESVEWNGEGLPPVGVECECCVDGIKFDGNSWVKSEVIAYHKGYAWISHADSSSLYYLDKVKFRKLESQEAKEERERLEAAYDLCTSVYPDFRGFDEFKKATATVNLWLIIVDKTNYRVSK